MDRAPRGDRRSKALREVGYDEPLRSVIVNDPDSALKDYDLSHEERRALLEGDIRFLYRLSINASLLGRLATGLFGRDADKYSERTRAEAGD